MIRVIARTILKVYYKLLYFFSCEGVENIPKDDGMLVCGNHVSLNDGLLVFITFNKKLKFLAKAELFNNKFTNWFFKSVGCVPVDRENNDIKAMRTCLKILNNDENLVLFPEGSRFIKHLEDVKPGAILFAIKSKKPIVPFGISKLKPFGKTVLRVGKPIYYDEYYDKKLTTEDYTHLLNKLMYEIFNLVDEKCCYYDEIKASVEDEN